MLRLAPLLLLLVLAATATAQPTDPVRLPIDFAGPAPASHWTVENDVVMGGKSEGGVAFPGETLVFSGVTNTDGGGFSSTRTRPADLDLGGADGLAVRYRADGRQYEVSVHTGERDRGTPVAFRAPLPVVNGDGGDGWHEARVSFDDFRASAHGRSLPDRRLDPAKARSVGLFIYDGVSGPFRLEVDRIETYTE